VVRAHRCDPRAVWRRFGRGLGGLLAVARCDDVGGFFQLPKVSDEGTEFLGLKYAENLKAAVLWRVEYRALLTSISIYAGLPFESAPLSHPAVAALQRLWEQRPSAALAGWPLRVGPGVRVTGTGSGSPRLSMLCVCARAPLAVRTRTGR
jgi:hypothetical protein